MPVSGEWKVAWPRAPAGHDVPGERAYGEDQRIVRAERVDWPVDVIPQQAQPQPAAAQEAVEVGFGGRGNGDSALCQVDGSGQAHGWHLLNLLANGVDRYHIATRTIRA